MAARRGDHRYRQQKGKTGRRLGREPQEPAHRDRDPGARGARHQGKRLRQTDQQSGGQVHLPHFAPPVAHTVSQPQQQPEADGGPGDDSNVPQVGLNQVVPERADDQGGNAGQHQVGPQGTMPLVGRIANGPEQGSGHLPQFPPEIHQHREQGAQMRRDIECQPLIRPAEGLAAQDEMSRTGYGQKFGQALNNRQNDYLQQGHPASDSLRRGRIVNSSDRDRKCDKSHPSGHQRPATIRPASASRHSADPSCPGPVTSRWQKPRCPKPGPVRQGEPATRRNRLFRCGSRSRAGR